MRVLLTSLPNVIVSGDIDNMTYIESIALLYLGSALREQGHEVDCWDSLVLGGVPGIKGYVYRHKLASGKMVLEGHHPSYIETKIRQYEPDIIGITIPYTSNWDFSLMVIDEIRTSFPDITIVIGGPHVTQNPQDCVEYADYVVTGEGEIAFPLLVKELEAGNKEPDIAGVWYKDKASIFELIDDIDSIAPPAWDLLPLHGEYYHWCNGEGRKISIFSSRGCPFDCSFCSSKLMNRRKWRAHSAERVLWEIDTLVNEYGVEGVLFRDDNPTVDIHRYHDIMEGIVKKDYGILMESSNFRADRLPKETIELMKHAGFKRVNLFPESGSQRVLDELIGKNLDLKDFYKTFENILDVGLDVGIYLQVGTPGETKEEIEATYKMATELKARGAKWFQISIATPIKGTRLYDECIKAGYIDGIEIDKFGFNVGSFDTEHWTAEEITESKHIMTEVLNS